jgi:hypothetical protein
MRIHLKNPHCSLGDFYPLSKEAVKVDFTRRSLRSGISVSRCPGHDMMKGRDSPKKPFESCCIYYTMRNINDADLQHVS